MGLLKSIDEQITLKERVYDALRTEIIMGNLQPGQQLNIVDLAKQLHTSRAPVREALSMLNQDGLIDLESYKRPRVAVGSPKDYQVINDLRMVIEPYAVRMSVQNIPQEKIDDVREQLENLLRNPSDFNTFIETDMIVHEMLFAYADSKVLAVILGNLCSFSIRFRYLVEQALPEKNEKTIAKQVIISTKEHLKLLDSLETRDPEKASATVLWHLKNSLKRNKLNH
ncbi:MAG TPA: GntR family transcriptional regulator [Desulfuromonadaceae bacterium]